MPCASKWPVPAIVSEGWILGPWDVEVAPTRSHVAVRRTIRVVPDGTGAGLDSAVPPRVGASGPRATAQSFPVGESPEGE